MSITRERLNSLAMQVWEESESECDTRTGRQLITDFAHALLKAVEAEMEVVYIRHPEYHDEAMGCGLEDHNITNRYEAMQYGWDCAIERIMVQIPDDASLIELPLIK